MHFPSGVLFMSELWISYSYRNTVERFVQLIFIDVVIWESVEVESYIHCFPRVVIYEVYSFTTLKCVFCLVTVGVVFVLADHHSHRELTFMAEIFPSSININTVGIFGQMVVGVVVWAPVNPSYYFFSVLVMHMEVLRKYLQYMFYLGTVEEAPVLANWNLTSGIVLWWIFGKPPVMMMKLVHWVAWLLLWWYRSPVIQTVISSPG